jgi:hypothetical protein
MILTQLALDTFQRADENPLDPTKWTQDSSHTYLPLRIVNRKCVSQNSGILGSLSGYTGVSWPADQYASFVIASPLSPLIFTDFQVVLRANSDASNCYAFEMDTSNPDLIGAYLYSGSNINPVKTFFSTRGPLNTGDEFLFIATGQTFYCFQNKVLISTFIDSAVASGNTGIFLDGATVGVINFSGGAAVVEPSTGSSGLGTFQGSSLSDAFPNPSGMDLAQVVNESGVVVWNLTASGTANYNPTNSTPNSLLGRFEGSSAYAAFTSNSDILQVVNKGGHVVFYVDFLGLSYRN